MKEIVESIINKNYLEAKSLIESAIGKIAMDRIDEMRKNISLDENLEKVQITPNLSTVRVSPPAEKEEITKAREDVDNIESFRESMYRHAKDLTDSYDPKKMSAALGEKITAQKAKGMKEKRQNYGVHSLARVIDNKLKESVVKALDKHSVNDDPKDIMKTAHEIMKKSHPSWAHASEKHSEIEHLFVPHFLGPKIKKEIENRKVKDEIPFEE